MISGAHMILYSKDPQGDRDFLKSVLKLSHVDVGGGWLIFGLPPSEIAVHPSGKNNQHEIYLICDDIKVFIASMAKYKIKCSSISDQGWGLLTQIRLPGGGKLGVYQPRHKRPPEMKTKRISKGIKKKK